MDDSQIVELYLSRDESAISQTSQKYGNKLKRIISALLSILLVTGVILGCGNTENREIHRKRPRKMKAQIQM